MKQIFCPDMAIVENGDITISQVCTIFTDDDSKVTLIKPEKYPEIGGTVVKDAYYIKDDVLVKVAKTEKVTDMTVTIKIADMKMSDDGKIPSWLDKTTYMVDTKVLYKGLVYVVISDHYSDKTRTPDITPEWYKLYAGVKNIKTTGLWNKIKAFFLRMTDKLKNS